ncbi:related to GPR1 and Fun34p [Lecanosticta acicola]|uniref:Related to GPR1 and Fun34p n=1 Tax=Lecanosticta acicola TaxID=111012 RepID=A0AAI8Z8B4_9PEZI|nr:related to GPR1 and Fun34p [Lecanosticta acicola]
MATNGQDEGGFYKDHGGPIGVDQLHPNDSRENALEKIRTAGSVSIPPELFEKLYLSPENKVKGDLRKTFGNPTPIGLTGFLLCVTPLACFLMNWRGTRPGNGAADIPVYLFFGGILLNVAGVMEWILGNTYISVVFMSYGCFCLSYGGVLQPFYGAYAAYAPDPVNAPQEGAMQPGFLNSFAFFLLFMGLLSLVFLVCSIRTNLVFFLILSPLPAAFSCIAAAFWYSGMNEASTAATLFTAGGALAFVTCIFGWYLWTALLLASVDAPIQLPVFDLSTRIKGFSERKSKVQDDGPV